MVEAANGGKDNNPPAPLGIHSLLKDLEPTVQGAPEVKASDIAFAISNIFTNQLSSGQATLLLYVLSITGLEQRPDVLARCATVMRNAAVPVSGAELKAAIKRKGIRVGEYHGGLCDIVGTGGDYHSTFNISTASSIICSSLLLIAKHGNRASTSKSGSADVLACMRLRVKTSNITEAPSQISPKLEAITPFSLLTLYTHTNYAFLFAPNFHTGLKHIASIRKELPCPSIFNLLGPLTNPAEVALEARVIGVKNISLVTPFASALLYNGVRKGMVVCGLENLDEISCAGETKCARLVVKGERDGDPDWFDGNAPGADTMPRPGQGDADEVDGKGDVSIEEFHISPYDFGLPRHALASVSPGGTAEENAAILSRLLRGELGDEHPIAHFVLMNAAALFVVAGACESEECPFRVGEVCKERGPGGGRWKEGVRLARLAINTGKALSMLRSFAEVTNGL